MREGQEHEDDRGAAMADEIARDRDTFIQWLTDYGPQPEDER